MYKSLWARVLACLAVVVVLSLSVLPLLASAADLNGEPWGKYSLTFTPPLKIENVNWISETELKKIIEIVVWAYRGGMFGGAYPYAIALDSTDSQTAKSIRIYTINHSVFTTFPSFTQTDYFENPSTKFDLARVDSTREFEADWMQPIAVQYIEFILTETGNFLPYSTEPSSQVFTPVTSFLAINKRINPSINGTSITAEEFQVSGQTWCYFNETSVTPPIKSQTIASTSSAPPEFTQKLNSINYAIAVNASVFDDGYNDGYDDGYDDGHDEGVLSGYQTGYNQGLSEGEEIGYTEGHEQGYQSGYDNGYDAGFDPGYRQGYDDGYTEGVATVPPVVLDIPSIFTAMFSGVHSIFQGFDINIFGISIAGMLLGILLIVLVAFVVKKLK